MVLKPSRSKKQLNLNSINKDKRIMNHKCSQFRSMSRFHSQILIKTNSYSLCILPCERNTFLTAYTCILAENAKITRCCCTYQPVFTAPLKIFTMIKAQSTLKLATKLSTNCYVYKVLQILNLVIKTVTSLSTASLCAINPTHLCRMNLRVT